METLSNELKDLGGSSSIPLTHSIFTSGSNEAEVPSSVAGRRSAIRGVSVGSQFRSSLQALVADLERTHPHYIRCIKPNLHKAKNSFDSGEVLRQLRYSGMMEAIRIRQEGYSLRELHSSFYKRFRVLLHPEDYKGGTGIEQMVKVLSKRLTVTDADWQIGHSKIFLRRELADKLERLVSVRVRSASRSLTRFGRSVAHQRASRLLVGWVRFRLVMIHKHRRVRASTKIGATFRSYTKRRDLRALVKAVTRLQSHQRRVVATRRVLKIRDPFGDMSFREVRALLKEEQTKLEAAVDSKDFQQAAKLEASLYVCVLLLLLTMCVFMLTRMCFRSSIKDALEEKRPMTRTILEDAIAEVQTKLDESLKNKDYDACGPLQTQLEELVAKRPDYPTIEELNKAVTDLEQEVAAAIAKRDFAAAALGQEQIEVAKKRVEDALEAEAIANEDDDDDDTPQEEESQDTIPKAQSFGFESRTELEEEISTLKTDIEASISKKDFNKASKLQVRLDEIEALRVHFPTKQELNTKLKDLKAKADGAIAAKKFAAAGELQEEIDALEQKLAALEEAEPKDESRVVLEGPDGDDKTFESRADLDTEITVVNTRVAEAVQTKKFKEAQDLQAYLDQLEAAKAKLPSLADLLASLAEKKSELEKAIANKDFAGAESINADISSLEEKIAAEKAKMPAVEPPPEAPQSTRSVPVLKPTVARTPIVTSNRPVTVAGGQRRPSTHTSPPVQISTKSGKRVSKLRPLKPVLLNGQDSIVAIAKVMAAKRTRAAVVPNGATGGVEGIITDVDITRRVVAKHLPPASTKLADVMTINPACVSTFDAAIDALTTMVENRYKHLPVLDDKGKVCGLLDISKCLDDAISRLEKAEEKHASAATDALQQVGNLQGQGAPHAAALQALLGPLLTQAFGAQTSPTLGSILAGVPRAIVSPSSTVLQAAEKMAQTRHAALIAERGQLVGLLSFKDVMSRVIAKELPLDQTLVSDVMTESPEFLSPTSTVLEALQVMHDNKFFTLPVCEDDGRVLGVLNVMDVIHGCGGADGWRSLFSSSMDDADDISEVSMATTAAKVPATITPVPSTLEAVSESAPERTVSKLRPKKALISHTSDSVLSVAQMLANKRGDASLIIGATGELAGIITDTDVTRRVVAKNLNPEITMLDSVMTANPTCVASSDSAMDALGTMVENHFRHLPVVDDSGAVVGLLDIAKCLNDAISRLERSQKRKKKGDSSVSDMASQVASLQAAGGGGANAAALQALLGSLMSQAFGDQTVPKLRSLLTGRPATIVSPDTSLREAGLLMAERRKAALVVKDGELVGIFGFKDMMSRAVAKSLPLDHTPVSAVMTPSPESVSPELTVLEAMQTMHDNKFLTLPVCEDDGRVVGMVDVMDVINGCGGADGWRSVFSSAMDCDDLSDASSVISRGTHRGSVVGRGSIVGSVVPPSKNERTVSKLRPKKPIISHSDDSVLSLCQLLANKRSDASLVVGTEGGLSGIMTDKDITTRVISKDLSPSSTAIESVMTSNPLCVSVSDAAMDALTTMVENRIRHLPVVDDSGAVVGLLDIARCLNDAISRLERAQEKSGSTSVDVASQMASLQAAGGGGANAAALQALLGTLMSQAFGGQAVPKLRGLLAGKPATVVDPSTSIRQTATVMAERRKACLVVSNGELVGIFGFKDMMSRVVAKELPLDDTSVSAVMTPNPEYVSPEMTVLEALQTMHDNKFLTLPVCEDDGRVVGLVDVMDVIYGCGGAEGWRSIFDQAMDLDDGSETASVYSKGNMSATRTIESKQSSKQRTVTKLRPKKPLISHTGDTVLSVTQMLANKRGDASLIIGATGELAGIITDTDVTRRVVAKNLNPEITMLDSVMTANPTCVASSDSAMDALGTMVENHFRHLPVVDDSGAVVGLLDIAKCLNDAISRLERSQKRKKKGDSSVSDMASQVASLQAAGGGGANAAALQALLGSLMSQAFGDQTVPKLRSLLTGRPATIVSPDTSLREAGLLMAERRKAALVVKDGELVGIFGFKDMMSRAVAKSLPLDHTPVSAVMTPSPESVSPELTVLEAMQTMHDNKFLTLPVCEDDGRVVGMVDVMDVINGCGGADGWRSVFSSAMDCDDLSDASSVISRGTHRGSVVGRGSIVGSVVPPSKNERTVSKLRPKKPIISHSDDSVLSLCQLLANKRSDASLVVGTEGGLSGIMTDKDITTRVISKDLSPSSTAIESVMTSNPLCVSVSDAAMDALTTMVENRIRHLPVVDDSGAVVGLLDIARCLNDAISRLERAQEKSGSTSVDVASQMASLQAAGGGGANAAALQALLGTLMSQAFGGQAVPKLRGLLAGKPATVVDPSTSIRQTATVMAERRKACLVVSNGELVGIFGFKDMMSRVVAKELPLDDTSVSAVMTPNPEYVSPEMTVLEALQTMHDNKFLTLPVCEDDGRVVGLVDVMDVIYGCGGAEGWRSIFDQAMDLDDGSVQQSTVAESIVRIPVKKEPVIHVSNESVFAPNLPGNIPNTVEITGDDQLSGSFVNSRGFPTVTETSFDYADAVVFKISDPDKKIHRVRCIPKLSTLLDMLAKKMSAGVQADSLQLQFVDDEGDAIMITNDDDLNDAVNIARSSQNQVVKLTVSLGKSNGGLALDDPMILGGIVVVVVVGIATIGILLSRRR